MDPHRSAAIQQLRWRCNRLPGSVTVLQDRRSADSVSGLLPAGQLAPAVPDAISRLGRRHRGDHRSAGTQQLAARAQVEHRIGSTALWTHVLDVMAGNDLAHNNLGSALADHGRVEEAVADYTDALLIKPDFAQAHSSLANGLAIQRKVSAAIAHDNEPLGMNPGNHTARAWLDELRKQGIRVSDTNRQ